MGETKEMFWLFVGTLKEGDIIEIQARHTRYIMQIVDPKKNKVVVNSNGLYITEETGAIIVGTLIDAGSMVKIGGITIGLPLSLFLLNMEELILPPIEELWVNGIQLLPPN